MAKQTINRQCGHQETIQIAGPYAGRERQAEYEASKSCRECYQSEQQAKREQAATAAAAANASNGLPALQGSDKQIAWAEQIRSAIIPQVEALRTQFASAPDEQARQKAEDALNAVIAEGSAGWWIEHRESSAKQLLVAKIAK